MVYETFNSVLTVLVCTSKNKKDKKGNDQDDIDTIKFLHILPLTANEKGTPTIKTAIK